MASNKIIGLTSNPPMLGTTERIQLKTGSCSLYRPLITERTMGCQGLIMLKETSQVAIT